MASTKGLLIGLLVVKLAWLAPPPLPASQRVFILGTSVVILGIHQRLDH